MMPKWDLIMVICLLFTATVTPVEVVFLDGGQYITSLWVVNRVVDLCFICDIVLTFFLGFQHPSEKGGHYVFNSYYIALTYVQGWFVIDLATVLPFWLLIMDYDDPFGSTSVELPINASAVGGAAQLTRTTVLLRVVKLLRMLKLARVFKASRVMQRFLLDFVMNRWEWTCKSPAVLELNAAVPIVRQGALSPCAAPSLTAHRRGAQDDQAHDPPQRLCPLAGLLVGAQRFLYEDCG